MAEGKNRAAGKWEQSEIEAQGEAWSGAVALLRVRRLAAWGPDMGHWSPYS